MRGQVILLVGGIQAVCENATSMQSMPILGVSGGLNVNVNTFNCRILYINELSDVIQLLTLSYISST